MVSVTDKASSQLYMSGLPMLGIGTVDGYLLSNPLTDENRADVAIQIPMMGGRDTSPFVFETIGGVEYVHYTDGLYMDCLLYTSSRCTRSGCGPGRTSARRALRSVSYTHLVRPHGSQGRRHARPR